MDIRNIVFDMGNVLVFFRPDMLIDAVGIEGEDKELLKNTIFNSYEWVQGDRGTLSMKDETEIFKSRLPQRLHEAAAALVEWWDLLLLPIPGMAQLIGDLKKAGHGIYLLTNANDATHQYFFRIPGSEYFDGLLISSDEKILKPQPEIYRLLCSRFGLKAEECFFIDDNPANIEGAIYTGMKGRVFREDDADLLRKDMEGMGLL